MVALDPITMVQHRLPFAPRIRENVAEMSRLVNAALVDRSFCSLLLSRPDSALEKGFNGEVFNLSPSEKEFVLNVQAKSLDDFVIRAMMPSKVSKSAASMMNHDAST